MATHQVYLADLREDGYPVINLLIEADCLSHEEMHELFETAKKVKSEATSMRIEASIRSSFETQKDWRDDSFSDYALLHFGTILYVKVHKILADEDFMEEADGMLEFGDKGPFITLDLLPEDAWTSGVAFQLKVLTQALSSLETLQNSLRKAAVEEPASTEPFEVPDAIRRH